MLIFFCYKSDKHQCQQWKSLSLHWMLKFDVDQKSTKLFLKNYMGKSRRGGKDRLKESVKFCSAVIHYVYSERDMTWNWNSEQAG